MRKKNERGVTLIEVVVVVALIAALSGLAIPNFREYRRRTFDKVTESDMRNLRTVMLAESAEESSTNFFFQNHTTRGPFNEPYEAAVMTEGDNILAYRWTVNFVGFNYDLMYQYAWHDNGQHAYYWYDYTIGDSHYSFESKTSRY